MDEATKNLIYIPVALGSALIMILQFTTNLDGHLGQLLINIAIGAAVGGAVFGALFFMNKR